MLQHQKEKNANDSGCNGWQAVAASAVPAVLDRLRERELCRYRSPVHMGGRGWGNFFSLQATNTWTQEGAAYPVLMIVLMALATIAQVSSLYLQVIPNYKIRCNYCRS